MTAPTMVASTWRQGAAGLRRTGEPDGPLEPGEMMVATLSRSPCVEGRPYQPSLWHPGRVSIAAENGTFSVPAGIRRAMRTLPTAVATSAPSELSESFEDVFREHHDRLVRLAGLLCGNAATAEDAVAEVFARLLRTWQPGRIDNVAAYLRRAVINELGMGFRRRDRERRVWAGGARPAVAPASDESGAERDHLWLLLFRLPVRQRVVLVLRFFDDLSEVAVAHVMDVPVGTVKSTASRGLARLRQLMEEEADDH